MNNIIKTTFILLLIISCAKKIDNIKIDKSKQYTIIFDFDDTMYAKNESHQCYLTEMYFSALKRTKYSRQDMINFIHDNNLYTTKAAQTLPKLKILRSKFNFKLQQEDIDYSVKKLNERQTIGLGNIVNNLTQRGYRVIVIGGGALGCASIPEFVKQFGIKKEDVYSGYYKDFSQQSLDKVISNKWAYVNCANPDDVNTIYSEDKSDLIKSLKQQNKIDNNSKIIHIGDGTNDLEVLKSGQADIFIGFGVNKVDKIVEKEASIFVKTINEFKEELDKILESK